MNRPTDGSFARRLAPPRGAEEAPLTTEEFDASFDAVEQALAARGQLQSTRRHARVAVVFAAAAAFVLVAVLWRSSSSAPEALAVVEASGAVSDVTSTRAQGVASGAVLEAGQRVKTDEGGSLTLRFPEGSIVAIGARSEFGIHGLGRHRNFELARGHFDAKVAKLNADETFVVETRRARVEVRGTQFTVDVEPPSVTCLDGSVAVKVVEGVVLVTSGDSATEVKAGEVKSLPCAAPPVVPEPKKPPEVPAPKRDEVSPLSRMNALYGSAMELKQSGKFEEAARAFRELRRAFPKSALDEAAAVEELRLLEKLGSERGAAAAREYLGEYPDGYGRDVAERLITP